MFGKVGQNKYVTIVYGKLVSTTLSQLLLTVFKTINDNGYALVCSPKESCRSLSSLALMTVDFFALVTSLEQLLPCLASRIILHLAVLCIL